MNGHIILLGGITLIALILTVLDGIAYRRQQKSGKNWSSQGAVGRQVELPTPISYICPRGTAAQILPQSKAQ